MWWANSWRARSRRDPDEQANGKPEVVLAGARLQLHEETLARHPGLPAYAGREVILGIRPEDLEDATLATSDGPRIKGQVELREALGSEVLVHFSAAAKQAVTEHVRELAEDVGDDRAMQQLEEGDMPPQTTLVGRFGARSKVKQGDSIEVAVFRAMPALAPRARMSSRTRHKCQVDSGWIAILSAPAAMNSPA